MSDENDTNDPGALRADLEEAALAVKPVTKIHYSTSAALPGAFAVIFLGVSAVLFAFGQAATITDLGGRYSDDAPSGLLVAGAITGAIGIALLASTAFIVLSYADYRHKLLAWTERQHNEATATASEPD